MNFVAYNVFRLNRAKRPVQTITGLTAALLRCVSLHVITIYHAQLMMVRSTAKLYDRHKTALIKAVQH